MANSNKKYTWATGGTQWPSERRKRRKRRQATVADGERDALFVKYGIGAGYASTKS